MSNRIPDGITKADIEQAIHDLDAGIEHSFGDSTGYDLVYNEKLYPPKAVLGLAARRLLGGVPLGPNDFWGGKGTKCFKVLAANGFTVRPKPGYEEPLTDKEPRSEDREWSDQELRAAVEAYLWMREREQRGVPYSKTDMNRALRDELLAGRSRGSVEYPMENISATLAELCLPWIAGYKPHGNVGEGVKQRIVRMLGEVGALEPSDYAPTAEEDMLAQRTRRLMQQTLQGQPAGNEKPVKVAGTINQYLRDPLIKAWVLQHASGRCELCRQTAPFTTPDGISYLEVHHVVPLASGGPDTIHNAVALCPNCHRRCHFASDRTAAIEALYGSVARLVRPQI